MTSVMYATRYVDVAYGSLVVYNTYPGNTATIYLLDRAGTKIQTYYAEVQRYEANNGQLVYAAVFPTLPAGNYLMCRPGFSSYEEKQVTVFPGDTAEMHYT